ncbi:MAG: hypothetical protein K0U45_07845 [Alphaproteobacteria bacterium]|nr:hypothetical protein [Alphaproteobacteria bacterium]
MSKSVKIIFIVSIVFNIISIGLVVGYAVHELGEHRMFTAARLFHDKPDVKILMGKARKEFKQHRTDTSRILTQMSEVLAQPEYDALSLEALIEDFKQIHVVRYDWLTLEILRIVENGTYEERQEMAKLLHNIAQHERGGKRRGRKGDRREPK